MSDLQQRLQKLSPKQRELVLKKLRQQQSIAKSDTSSDIKVQTEREHLPLSFAQRRLWFIDQQLQAKNRQDKDDRRHAYHVPLILQLSGDLNISQLEQALSAMVKRHESLRTTFPLNTDEAGDQVPVQKIASAEPVKLTVVPFDNLHSFIKQQPPFDLGQGPLWRAALLQQNPQRHILVVLMHHIITDGWSMANFKRELSQLYAGAELAPLTLQYGDYSHWLQQQLQSTKIQEQLSLWQQKLADAPTLLDLPTDQPRPDIQRFAGRSEFISLGTELTDKLNRLSQATNSTPYMVLMALYSLLLARYSGQNDLCIGSIMANRTMQEIEPLMGCFVNTLPLRIQLTPDIKGTDFIKAVRDITLEAQEYQHLPFEKLIETLKIERTLAHNPLFQVAFSLQNMPDEQLTLGDLTVEHVGLENTTTHFDISLIVRQKDGNTIAEWDYNSDLFEPQTMKAMARHFKNLAKALVANPEQNVHHLSMLSEQEQQQIEQWSQHQQGTDLTYPNVIEQIEQLAAKQPNQLAIVEPQTSYEQLNQRANQIAQGLMAIKPQLSKQWIIPIIAERSESLIAGMVGIVKAGGAYLPIDPQAPLGRIEYLLKDSNAPIVLVEPSHINDDLKQLFGQLDNTKVIALSPKVWQKQSSENPPLQSQANTAAYVIYTSGSTGQPKGVVIEHRALANLVNWHHNTFTAYPNDRTALGAGVGFDASAWEIWSALSAGVALYPLPQKTLLDPEELHQLFIRHQITSLFMSTPLIENWPEQPSLKDTALRYIHTGGDALRQVPAGLPCPLVNNYGPTENTVISSSLIIAPDSQTEITIGKPISGVQIYILDSQKQPLPANVPGEIYLAGNNLARGYLNRAELDAEKFHHIELFGQTVRVYQTGDKGKWLANGEVKYLGRNDNQVKIRGQRIELGEIEASLSKMSQIQDAIVKVHQGKTGKQLIAYVISHAEQNAIEQWKQTLSQHLPDPMIPSHFVLLEQWPLTPNGKIDRQALTFKPTENHNTIDNQPQTGAEQLLADLWRGLLAVENITRDDNFFDLGGHSLLATKLVSRIRQSFDIDLPLGLIFEKPRLATLAEAIAQHQVGITISQIKPQQSYQSKVLSFAQQRLWFLTQIESVSSSYNMPFAFKLKGQLDISALQASLQYLIERHQSLRMCFPQVNGQPTVKILASVDIDPLTITDLRHLTGEALKQQAKHLTNQHGQAPFDISHGPLFTAQLLQLSEQENILLLNLHHIIGDGWSMGIFKREWRQAYGAFAAGQQPELPAQTIQYSDFAAWQRQYLQGDVIAKQLDYWQQQLKAAPEVLNLPSDYPRPATQSYQGERFEYRLSSQLSQQLKDFSHQQELSLFMTLLSGFELLLSRYSGSDDICIGCGIANRNHDQTEDLIGFFVNTLVLRGKIKSEQTFVELAQQTKQVCLNGYAHQDLPFEYLVEQLKPERSLAYNPLFQVAMVLQNHFSEHYQLPGIEMTAIDQQHPFAKVDLTLDLVELDDQLICTWEYATDLFKTERISRMAQHFEVLLQSLMNNPNQAVYRHSLIPTAEQQQIQQFTEQAKQTFILDLHQQIQPIGIPGQLYICDVHHSANTDAEFIEHTLFDQKLRLYKTNDFAYWDLDGNVKSLGRVDQQIHIRGTRIEQQQIQNKLMQHPKIKQAIITAQTVGQDQQLTAYIVPELEPEKNSANTTEQNQQWLNQWIELFQDTYDPDNLSDDHSLNTIGWKDSYSDEDIPQASMEQWRDMFIARVLALAPQRVWEIGCGTGMILFPTAPNCQHYLGTDISANSLSTIEKSLSKQQLCDKVSLLHRPADNFEGIEAASRDLVIINSVVQYFPSQQYFLTVLEGAMNALATNGKILLGDIRHLPLADAFFTAIHYYHADEQLGLQQLQNNIQRHHQQEEELMFDPAFFYALKHSYSRIKHVDIQLKHGLAHTEMTRFRYDVTLYLDHNPTIDLPHQQHQWSNRIDLLEQQLVTERPEVLWVNKITNARLTTEMYLVKQLKQLAKDPAAKVADLKATLTQVEHGYEIDSFKTLAEKHQYHLHVQYNQENPAAFDVIFHTDPNYAVQNPPTAVPDDWQVLTNQPMHSHEAKITQAQVKQYQQALAQQLPQYMVPQHFIQLDSIPHTKSGEPDFDALTAQFNHYHSQLDIEQTLTESESQLADIWRDLLHMTQINRHDSFFQLGGHSLLATRLAAAIRDSFNIDMPVRHIFESPVLSDLAQVIDKAKTGIQLPPITPLADDAIKPLSFAQQRLWILAQLQSDSPTYNVPNALSLKGKLDEQALSNSLKQLVHRHSSLRMIFDNQQQQPQVKLLDEQAIALDIKDLQHLTGDNQTKRMQQLIDQHGQIQFDLTQGPLFAVSLLRLNPQHNILLINMHHIISDGWSMGVLMREWSQLYRDFHQGQEPSLQALPISYSDYAAWQRSWLQGEALELQIQYWQQQLANAPTLLELPLDHPRPATPSHQGDHYQCTLPNQLTKALKQFSIEQDVTLFMTLLSTFALLLSRYSRQNDICIGSPIANRNHSDSQNLIGFFVNTLVMRCQINPKYSFAEYLQQTKTTCLQAYAHQDVPFETLVEKLQPERSQSYSPLYQVMMAFQNNSHEQQNLDFTGLEAKRLEQAVPFSRTDLTLGLIENGDTISCTFEYATDLFDSATIAHMAQHFEVLLTSALSNSQQSLAHLSMITPSQINQLQQWNQTQTSTPPMQTLIEMFEHLVQLQPDATALVFNGSNPNNSQTLTYQQLNRNANRLAHGLLAHQPKSQQPWFIAISTDHSIELITGILAILKAGGSYVPIDPSYPADRIEFMLKDSKAPLLLSTTQNNDKLPSDCQALPLANQHYLGFADTNPALKHNAATPAYVIYTSGSTGRPKGVVVENRSVTNLLHVTNIPSKQPVRMLQAISISFDPAVLSIFWTLAKSGGSLYLEPTATLHSNMPAVFKQNAITHCLIPPALLGLLQNQSLPELRFIEVGGDICTLELVNTWAPGRILRNAYGPTEATIYATKHTCQADGKIPTIGKPIGNMQAYILDENHQPVPPGIPGELCLAGVGLAQGYLNRPELTAEKFININIFGDNKRVYKTGDLALWQQNGELRFIGRLDNQVKLNGLRIELGEIETLLRQHQAVKAVAVIVWQEDGNPRLSAYVVTKYQQNEEQLITQLKQQLQHKLPDYMIPNHFTLMTQLPLTANGKVNHKALPAPKEIDTQTIIEPTCEREQQILQIWQQLFERQDIGTQHNFFEIGGHSLLAIKMITQLQSLLPEPLREQLTLSRLFSHPTIAALNQQIEQIIASKQQSHRHNPDLLPLQTQGEQTPLFCVAGGNGYGFYFRELAKSLGDNQPLFALEAPGRDGQGPIPESVEDHAKQLIRTVKRQQANGPYRLAGYSSGSAIAFEMAYQLELQGETVEQLVIIDSGLITNADKLLQQSQLDWLWHIIHRVETSKNVNLGISYQQLENIKDEQARWDLIADALYRFDVMPEHNNIAVLKTNLEVSHHLTVHFLSYQSQGKQLQAPIVLFRANEVDASRLAEFRQITHFDQAHWGWQNCTQQAVKVIKVNGNHGSILYPPNVDELANNI